MSDDNIEYDLAPKRPSPPRPPITLLREAVSYDPHTGALTRKDTNKSLFNDRVQGSLLGYSGLSRPLVAFAHYHGYWPTKVHCLNKVALDTRIANLMADPAQANIPTLLERIRALFSYDPKTGETRWKENHPQRHQLRGQLALTGVDYSMGGKKYPSAHLIWAHHYGELPPDDKRVLFLNGDKTDRRIDNLKLISRGISPYQGRWKVYTNSNYRGMRATLEEAEEFLELLKTRA